MAPNLLAAAQKVKLMNAMQRGSVASESPTIKVCIRVRPFIQEEISGQRSGGQTSLCIAMPTETHVEIVDDDNNTRTFEYDRTYWSHDEAHPLFAAQETLQTELGEHMITQALNGFNNCIFAYGQTGSGKSFSVLGGSGDARGLLPRIVEGFFDRISTLPETTTVKTVVAILEIYNEQLRDLLAADDGDGRKKLDIKQHPVLGTIVPGLTEAPVSSCQEVLDLVDYGVKMRMVSATAMNACSSRSHCIFTVKNSLSESGQARVSQTHLVDLAGSERSKRTGAQGDRLKEGAAINQSLSTLARVISELAKGGKKSRPPFRDSKLTYLLKESLCGNSKTIMMAAISPNLLDYEETLSTLKFAESVKKVQTSAVVNQVNEKGIEAKLRKELEELKAELRKRDEQEQGGGGEKVKYLEQRVREQEQLCALWGKDWDTFRELEQSKAMKRASMSPQRAEEIMTRFRRESLMRIPEAPSHRGSWLSTIGGEDPEPRVCLLRIEAVASLAAAIGGTGDADVLPTTADPNELVLVGPRAQILGEDSEALQAFNEKTDIASDKLSELFVSVEKAQETLNEHAVAGKPYWCFRVQASVDVLEPSQLGLAVRAATEPWPEEGEAVGDFIREEEIVTAEQFEKRMAWVYERIGQGADETEKFSDLWRASGPHHAAGVAAAATVMAKDAEIEDLKQRLAACQEEVARLRLESSSPKKGGCAPIYGAGQQEAALAVARLPPGKAVDQIRGQQAQALSLIELVREKFQKAVEGVEGVTEVLRKEAASKTSPRSRAKTAPEAAMRPRLSSGNGGSPRSPSTQSSSPRPTSPTSPTAPRRSVSFGNSGESRFSALTAPPGAALLAGGRKRPSLAKGQRASKVNFEETPSVEVLEAAPAPAAVPLDTEGFGSDDDDDEFV